MSRLSRSALNAMYVALFFFVICAFCFIHTEKLRRNYNDIKSGSENTTCTTIEYDVKQSGGYWHGKDIRVYVKKRCKVYAIDECPLAKVKYELTHGKIDCVDALVQSFMDKAPIGSQHLYYYFLARPSRYHSPEKYEAYIEKYSRNPFVDMMVLTGFTVALVLVVMVSCSYLCLRKSCKYCCDGEDIEIASTLPAKPIPEEMKTPVWTNPSFLTPAPVETSEGTSEEL